MKNVREKLISLLGLCSDDETEATKLQLLTSIMQSEDYTALSKSVALKKPFEDLYNRTKLEELSNSELKIEVRCFTNWYHSINNLCKAFILEIVLS